MEKHLYTYDSFLIKADSDCAPSGQWPYNSNPTSGNPVTSGGTTTSLPIPGSGNPGAANGGGFIAGSGSILNGSSGITWTPGSTTTTTTGTATWTILPTSANVGSTTTPKVVREKVCYVIVKDSGTRMMLDEQDVITPQEMIGISKFLSVVTIASQASYNNIIIEWSKLIADLGIERHFTTCMPASFPANVLEVILYDPT